MLTNRLASVYGTKFFMILRNQISISVRAERDSSVPIHKDHTNVYVRTVMNQLMMQQMDNVMISTNVNWGHMHVLRILSVQIFLVSRIFGTAELLF